MPEDPGPASVRFKLTVNVGGHLEREIQGRLEALLKAEGATTDLVVTPKNSRLPLVVPAELAVPSEADRVPFYIKILIDHYPTPLTARELGEMAGVPRSTWRSRVHRLKRQRIIVAVGPKVRDPISGYRITAYQLNPAWFSFTPVTPECAADTIS